MVTVTARGRVRSRHRRAGRQDTVEHHCQGQWTEGSVSTTGTPRRPTTSTGTSRTCRARRRPGERSRIGITSVTCSVTDSSGNVGSASFTVTVADRTDPVLHLPPDLWIQTTETSLPKTNSRIASFLGGATADDVVDSSPDITTNAPATFSAGETLVTFTAKDTSGNDTSATAKVTISPIRRRTRRRRTARRRTTSRRSRRRSATGA